MSTREEILAELVALSRWLGAPERDLVILGEGNTSAAIDEQTFFVKASGTELGTIGPEGFVEVHTGAVLKLLEKGELSDEEVMRGLGEAVVGETALRPSVETFLHAAMLARGARFVGHTHPSDVNAILCSNMWREVLEGRLFPDEVICCGPAPCLVPYTDPGVRLAHAVIAAVEEYQATQGTLPKTVYIQNHGLIAVGESAREVRMITAMAVKAARIAWRAAALGGVHFLDEANIARLYTRPDEKYRERVLRGEQPRQGQD